MLQFTNRSQEASYPVEKKKRRKNKRRKGKKPTGTTEAIEATKGWDRREQVY